MKDTSQGNIKHKILHNTAVNIIYKSKFYFNVMMEEVGYLTNKLPEIAGALIILDKLGVIVPASWIVPLCIGGYVSLVCIGWVWKRVGLYDTARYIEAHRHPVQDELLRAARTIERCFGGKKK